MQYCTIFIANQNFAVQHLVIAQDVIDHLLVDVLGCRLESDLHATRLLLLQIDVSATVSVMHETK